MIGQTLSNFRITAKLGEGGMGEVYLAEDMKLGREVAIKVLPEAFVADPERLARFEREAHLLASLEHPNIAGIHQVEEVDGIHFLVMELARGETLAEWIGRGPIPVEEATAMALQIARALEAAHEKGIVHRDLKPANIMVGPDGSVKVLDFGLARTWEEPSDVSSASQSPTLTAQMTQAGTLLGTAAYMSPEQAKGRTADKRADIWAFGCVLFEMLAGGRLFARDSVVETLSAILEREPDWSRLPEALPAGHRRLLERCLVKDRHQRLHDIADARIELEAPEPAPESVAAPVSRARKIPWLFGAATLGALLGGLGSWALLRATAPEDPPASGAVERLNLAAPSAAPVTGEAGDTLALSPRGDYVVYVARSANSRQLYVRQFDRLDPEPIPGTENATTPFISPDGTWVGFEADGKLKKVSLQGGPAVTLCDASSPRGASWADDDTIVFHGGAYAGLFTVQANGGQPRKLTEPATEADEGSHRWPQALPGSRAALFTIQPTGSQGERTRIGLVSLETGEYRTLIDHGTHARFSPSGHVVYARQGSLFAVLFDLDRLEVIGSPVPVIGGIREFGSSVKADFDLSPSGALIYLPAQSGEPNRSLVWADRDGRIEPIAADPRPYGDPSISPQGDRIAVVAGTETGQEVWIYGVRRQTWIRLTTEASAILPRWSPDGDHLVFGWNRDGAYNVYSIAADGMGVPRQLTEGIEWSFPYSWLPDGSGVVFQRQNPVTGFDVWLHKLNEDPPDRPLLTGPFWEMSGVVSPDGRWLAYSSNESGTEEVFVRSYPALGDKVVISSGGGVWPRWSADGSELFYATADKLMHLEIGDGSNLGSAIPVPLFALEVPDAGRLRAYDVTPDGRRFAMILEPRREEVTPQIVLVPRFADELRARFRRP